VKTQGWTRSQKKAFASRSVAVRDRAPDQRFWRPVKDGFGGRKRFHTVSVVGGRSLAARPT
jgi:hypothetical protein